MHVKNKMSKILKIIFAGILILIALLLAWIIYHDYNSTLLEGKVYDCDTNESIAGAALQVPTATTLLDILTFHWDSAKVLSSTTNQSGMFSIKYRTNAFNVHVIKEGYLDAQEYGYVSKHIRIGIRKQSNTTDFEFSHMCRRFSECYIETKDTNGATITKDVCGPLN